MDRPHNKANADSYMLKLLVHSNAHNAFYFKGDMQLRVWNIQIKNENGTLTTSEGYNIISLLRLADRLKLTEREIWNVLLLQKDKAYNCPLLRAEAIGSNKYDPLEYEREKAIRCEPNTRGKSGE